MKHWTCSECGATGTAKTAALARKAHADHIGQHHNDVDF